MINLVSAMALPISVFSDGRKVDSGTGFIYFFEEKAWLITNWHLFTGRDSTSPERPKYPTPTHISVIASRLEDKDTLSFQEFTLPLNIGGRSAWIQHAYGPPYDIAAIPFRWNVDYTPHFRKMGSFLGYSMVGDIDWGVSSECFVLGFPQVRGNRHNLPIWKRATVASEPDLDYASQPMFLVDTLTSGGMSGSPVVLFRSGSYTSRGGALNAIAGAKGPAKSVQLIGVYSGRYLEDDPLAPQLGKVWRISTVDEMLSNPSPGFLPGN